jgi:hypothetical protein
LQAHSSGQEERVGKICIVWSFQTIYSKSHCHRRWNLHVALAVLEFNARIAHSRSSLWWMLDASTRRRGSRMSIRHQAQLYIRWCLSSRRLDVHYRFYGLSQGGKSYQSTGHVVALVFATLFEVPGVARWNTRNC